MCYMKLIKILLLTVIPFTHTYGADHNITFFGAKADGITVSTKAIQKAIDESSKRGGGELLFRLVILLPEHYS